MTGHWSSIGPIELLPELEAEPPYCSRPGCDGQTEADPDGFVCPDCGGTWPRRIGEPGVREPVDLSRE